MVATAAAVTLAIVFGLVDYLTGREWAISAFYLLPVCIAGWVAERSVGFAVGALCAVLWFLSDLFSGPAYQHPRRIEFVNELPWAGTNKIDRAALSQNVAAWVTLVWLAADSDIDFRTLVKPPGT